MQNDDWPTMGAELGRKSMAVVEKWMTLFNAGKISKREAFILLDGLYDSISGLAPKDVCDLIADLHKEIRTASPS